MSPPTRRRARLYHVAIAGCLAGLLLGVSPQSPSAFAGRIAALSEPGGYFDTDNLISNEASYLEVLPALAKQKVQGGAYIGVGPDQNFSYVAAIRPEVAFMLDVRRDNMLLHLLFKALFALSGTRVEYLSHLFGRPPPAEPARWRDATIERLVTHVDGSRPDEKTTALLRGRVDAAVKRLGVPLSAADLQTIDRFHRRFITASLDLRFQSFGRMPRRDYPAYRELLLGRDPSGVPANFLASEESFQFLKGLQARDAIIPVIGDVSGPKALAAIGRLLAARGSRLSAFYISNVEFYLFADGRFPRYVSNLRTLPLAPNAVLIRSTFGPYASGSRYSSTELQPIAELLERVGQGRVGRYWELVGKS